MKRWGFILLCLAGQAAAQSGRIYTAPEAGARGGIAGTLPGGGLTHVLAVDQERVKVFRGMVAAGGAAFRFERLPVGKYDVVLLTKTRRAYEGLRLGNDSAVMPTESLALLEKRIALADSFFNRHKIHRWGIDGERLLVFVERIRDRKILQGSGEKLDVNLRRFEVIELAQATEDWQMIQTRHLYREGEPIEAAPPFFQSAFVAGLSSIRVVDSIKELEPITLPKD